MKARIVVEICRVLALAIIALSLAACQSVASKIPVDASDTEQRITSREAALSSLDWFTVKGGLGIWTDEESISARMDWSQAPGELLVTLVAPLGLGTMELHRDDAGATLTRGTSVIERGPSADRVLQRGLALEQPIPLNQMSIWLRGLPGEADKVKRDERGRIDALEYRDGGGVAWQANFLKYTEFDGLEVPALISARGGPYNVRLKLQDWVLASAEDGDVTEKSQNNNGKSTKRLAIPSQ